MDGQPSRRLGEWLKMGLSGPVLSHSRRILTKDGQNPTDKITLRYFVIHYRSLIVVIWGKATYNIQ